MNEQQNTSFFSRLFGKDRPSRACVRSVAFFAVLLVAVILLNVLLSLIPCAVTSRDLTEDKQFSISSDSVAFLKRLEQKITIHVICANGEIGPTMETFLAQYQAASKHILVNVLDPAKDKTKIESYGLSSETLASSASYVIVVESDQRYQLLDATEFSVYYIDGLGELPALSYLSLMNQSDSYLYQLAQYYAQYNIDIFAAVPYLCSEREITMAIDYVTSETIPHVYVASGHSELEFGTYMTSFLQSAALQYEYINLRDVTSIPADASALLIYAPTVDFTESETQMVLDYMARGGHVTMMTNPSNTGMTNLMRIAESVGLAPISGVIHEGNANNFDKTPSAIKPMINETHSVTSSGASNGYAVVLPNTHGIKMPDQAPTNLSMSALFVTSESAYVVNEDGTETELGSTAVATAVQNPTTGSKFVWFACQNALEDTAVKETGINAMYYFATALFNWQYRDYTPRIEPSPILVSTSQMELDGFSVYLAGILFAVLVPAFCLGFGISIRIRRKNR